MQADKCIMNNLTGNNHFKNVANEMKE